VAIAMCQILNHIKHNYSKSNKSNNYLNIKIVGTLRSLDKMSEMSKYPFDEIIHVSTSEDLAKLNKFKFDIVFDSVGQG